MPAIKTPTAAHTRSMTTVTERCPGLTARASRRDGTSHARSLGGPRPVVLSDGPEAASVRAGPRIRRVVQLAGPAAATPGARRARGPLGAAPPATEAARAGAARGSGGAAAAREGAAAGPP